MSSKIIWIHRHFSIMEMSQEDPEVKSWMGQAFKAIGPYRKNKITATGLTKEEIKILMPTSSGVGLEPTDRNFSEAVRNYYDSLLTRVDKDGLRLEIGLENDLEPLSESNMPINTKDYIIYRHAKEHPDVASTKDEAVRYYNKKFYIVDPQVSVKETIKLNDLEDEAMEVYFRHRDDIIKIDQILTLMGKNTDNLDKSSKVIELKKFATRNSNNSETLQKELFKKFIEVATDKDLEMKFLVQEGIAVGYLKRVGISIVYAETGNLIGESMEAAVLYFKNPKRSKELNLLKANYQEKSKKGKEYLPKEDLVTDKAE